MGKNKRKTDLRIERRQNGYERDNKNSNYDMHKPGSQNRNKK